MRTTNKLETAKTYSLCQSLHGSQVSINAEYKNWVKNCNKRAGVVGLAHWDSPLTFTAGVVSSSLFQYKSIVSEKSQGSTVINKKKYKNSLDSKCCHLVDPETAPKKVTSCCSSKI